MPGFGSVTDLDVSDRGCHAIVGSHGGVASGYAAAECGVASVIFHDAGVGLDCAGIAALPWLESKGIPAAAVSHNSARIGDPQDMWEHGKISWANGTASGLGVTTGQDVKGAHDCLHGAHEPAASETPAMRFSRVVIEQEGQTIVLCDSASLIEPIDAGRIVVTGSHGGLPGGNSGRAIKAPPALAVFNDAGVGKDKAGVARLWALDRRGIPGICVDCRTARIGEALSTLETGVLSEINEAAARAGLKRGMAVRTAIKIFSNQNNEA